MKILPHYQRSRIRTVIMLTFSLVVAFNTTAFAEEIERNVVFGQNLELAMISNDTEFTVQVEDGVSDGCWLNASRAKSLIERELLDAGYSQIVDERAFGALIYVEVIGYQTSASHCVAHATLDLDLVDFDLRTFEVTEVLSVQYSTALHFGRLLSGPKNAMSGRIVESLAEFTDQMLVDIQQEKNSFRQEIRETEASDLAINELLSIID